MGEPSTNYSNPAYGAQLEIVHAMSSLNMEPMPLKEIPEDAVYLSETDHWCKHSMEHLYAAVELTQKAGEIYAAVEKLMLFSQEDWDFSKELTHEEILSFLSKETQKRRAEMKGANLSQALQNVISSIDTYLDLIVDGGVSLSEAKDEVLEEVKEAIESR